MLGHVGRENETGDPLSEMDELGAAQPLEEVAVLLLHGPEQLRRVVVLLNRDVVRIYCPLGNRVRVIAVREAVVTQVVTG